MGMKTIGGHIFVRDGIRLDYCVVESVNSLLPICDEVVVMDCGSKDGTVELLRDTFHSNPKVRLVFDGPWEQYDGRCGLRLAMIADDCRRMLKTDWQFMLQADEVLHEMSYDMISTAVESGLSDKYVCRRVDLWGDVDRCIFLDTTRYPQDRMPMNPDLVRLAKKNVGASGDAGELMHYGSSDRFMEGIVIYHYSMVRDPVILNRKIVEMHSWYHGQGPDERQDDVVVQWMNQGKPFDYTVWKTDAELQPIPYPHPSHAAPWVDRHRK